MEILFLITGITIGAIAVFFILKNTFVNKKDLQIQGEIYESKIKTIEKEKNEWLQSSKIKEKELSLATEQINEFKKNIDALREKENHFLENNASIKADNKNLQEKLDHQKKDLEELNKRFTTEFENITHKLLERSAEKLNTEGKEQLGNILKPFQEKLGDLKKQIGETYEKETSQRIQLHEQVKQLYNLNQQISKEAQNLTNALKSNSKVQGDWGEEILENILQQSGLRKGSEYDVQVSFQDKDGKNLRPDMIVHYPDKRDIIIDSKVSLTDYERFISSENTVEKEAHLKAHIQSVKQHIKELSEKSYQDLYQIDTLDFVMMFIPIEGAYYIAVEKDSTLWQYAYERKIILINPTNLITALKMISNLWQQDFQNKNVLEIARQSGALYDSFVMLLNDITKIEKKFKETSELFDNVQKRIASGKGNIVGRIEKIKKLGAKTKKTLPDNYKDALE